MQLPEHKKAFFLSDLHLGMYPYAESARRERDVVRWLEQIRPEAGALFFLGDIFDFWFEYKLVVPKGFSRFLGKIAELADQGIDIHFFAGNHDTWMYSYFEQELGVHVHADTLETEINGKRFFLGHGDGVGPVDPNYRRMRKFFRLPFMKRLYAALHPCIGVGFGRWWAKKSAGDHRYDAPRAIDPATEPSVLFARAYMADHPVQYIVVGHRHAPAEIPLGPSGTYINTGDWISRYSYAVFDGEQMTLHTVEKNAGTTA